GGALRQGSGQPVPPRLALPALPRRQGSGAVHLARGPAAAQRERPDVREPAGRRARLADCWDLTLVRGQAPDFAVSCGRKVRLSARTPCPEGAVPPRPCGTWPGTVPG